jgi:hypothetical protein
MPEMPMQLTDRENQTLDFERVCPHCGDVITEPKMWWDGRRCCLPCGFSHPEPGPRMDPVTRKWISEPWESHT